MAEREQFNLKQTQEYFKVIHGASSSNIAENQEEGQKGEGEQDGSHQDKISADEEAEHANQSNEPHSDKESE